ncbi:MAG: hypothetical protein R3A79_08985 [Nannocystaceae bacterium]
MRRRGNGAFGAVAVAACMAFAGCSGDDGEASATDSGTGGTDSGTAGTGSGTAGTGSATGTTGASDSDAATETAGTTGLETFDCGLAGADDESYFTGSFQITQITGVNDVPPTGVFDALVGVDVCFSLAFHVASVVDEAMAQRRVIVDEVVIKTDDMTGVADMTFVPSEAGGMYLRLPEFSPYVLILSVSAGGPDLDGLFSFEIVCQAPEPFELDAEGLPILQSMSCSGGSAALRRFEGASTVTDIASGGAKFSLHVP